jgi:hypothetical protein
VLSTSLGGLVLAPQAHATNWGVSGSSPLTIDTEGTQMQIGDQAVAPPAHGQGVSWSPDGSKTVYEVGQSVYVSNADGTDRILVGYANSAPQTDHPVIAYDGELVVFSGLELSPGGVFRRTIQATWANGSAVGKNGPEQWDLPLVDTPDDANDIRPDCGYAHIAFERVQGASSSIYVRAKDNAFVPFKVANGRWPSVSPDGTTVAYIAADSQGHDQIWTVPTALPSGALPTPVQQTFLTSGIVSNTSFSPDGLTIAFMVSGGSGAAANEIRTVAHNTDPSATSNPDTVVTPKISVTADTTLSYRSETRKQVVGLAGGDRTATALATSEQEWKDYTDAADYRRPAHVAVLSRSDTFADALGGASLAAHKNGPLLLTGSTSLDHAVLTELQRILAPGSTVYLLGGTSALSPDVASAVQAAGFAVQRISGSDRYQTSVAIAKAAVSGVPSNILIATGQNFPDALSAGAAAAADSDSVVVLTADGTMPSSTAGYLESFGTDFNPQYSSTYLWAVGGQALHAIDYSGLSLWRIPENGSTRFDTSMMLARDFFPYTEAVGFATANNFPDSLAGGALMGDEFGPLLLVDPAQGLTADEKKYLDDNRGEIWEAFLFGGQIAWSSTIQDQVKAGIGGPLGFVSDPSGAAVDGGAAPAGAGAHAAVAARAGDQDGTKHAVGRDAADASGVKPTRP